MKRINSISLAVLSLISAAFVFSSCEKENFKGVDSKYVVFKVSTEKGIDTKASASEVIETADLSTDGLSLFIGGSVRQNVEDVFSNEVVTKGSIITAVTNPVVTMAKPDGSVYAKGVARPAFGNENDSYWCLYDVNSDEKVVWPEDGGTYKFWSYAGTASFVEADANNKIAYTGNTPSSTLNDATGMNDFVVAYSGVAHQHADPQNLVGLKFYHALSAVRFDFDLDGATITKVMVSNVKKDGVVTYNVDKNTYNTVFSWDASSSERVTYAQTDFSSEENCTFFFVPQAINEIYVTFSIKKGDKEYQITAKGNKLGVNDWKPGCIYTYTVSTSANGNVGIQIDEQWDENEGFSKSDVVVTNTKRSTVYVRACVICNWCNASGKVVASASDSEINLSYNTNDWVKSGAYYYSKKPVIGYTSSASIINDFTLAKAASVTDCGELHLEMVIAAQAIECDDVNSAAQAESIWGVSLSSF